MYIPSSLAKGFPSTPLLIKLWQISLRKSATGSILWLAAAAFVMRSAKGFMVSRVDLKPLAREDECKHVSSVLMTMEARWCHITKITFWLWYKNFVYTQYMYSIVIWTSTITNSDYCFKKGPWAMLVTTVDLMVLATLSVIQPMQWIKLQLNKYLPLYEKKLIL